MGRARAWLGARGLLGALSLERMPRTRAEYFAGVVDIFSGG